jgi:P-type Cu2+ transporter
VVLLSGDSPAIVQQVAASLQMDEAHGGMLPDQKLAYVRRLQQQGAVVVMVGDGMNDAAVLRGADVSFAMGSGAALAQSHADAVLIHAQLSLLLDAADAAAACMRVIRQNLAWATLYNSAGHSGGCVWIADTVDGRIGHVAQFCVRGCQCLAA